MYAGIWTYPWDLLDGGPAEVLGEIAGLGLTAVHLATSYHTVHALAPHNPRRRTFLAERGALYFRPDPQVWQDCALKPTLSPLLDEQGDALEAAQPLCRALGLKLVAWTVCLHNTDLAYRHPQSNVINFMGERYSYSLCAVNPQVRTYVRTLVRDLQERVDVVELESPHWMPFPHHYHAKLGAPNSTAAQLILTLCFCSHCREKAAAAGADPERLAHRLGQMLDRSLAHPPQGGDAEQVADLVAAEPDLQRFLDMREAAVTSLIAELAQMVGRERLRVAPMGSPWLTGADLGEMAPLIGMLEMIAYGSPAEVAGVIQETKAQLALKNGQVDIDRLLIGLSLLYPQTPDRESLMASFRAVRQAGVSHVCFYNYGLATAERVQLVRDVLQI
ncbi:MAG: hypothetical protein HY326_10920 [Chloroflexi bacterium]|nr:hypothetical protein [Chloroflexota bacterium]